jgi:hypothetical protein
VPAFLLSGHPSGPAGRPVAVWQGRAVRRSRRAALTQAREVGASAQRGERATLRRSVCLVVRQAPVGPSGPRGLPRPQREQMRLVDVSSWYFAVALAFVAVVLLACAIGGYLLRRQQAGERSADVAAEVKSEDNLRARALALDLEAARRDEEEARLQRGWCCCCLSCCCCRHVAGSGGRRGLSKRAPASPASTGSFSFRNLEGGGTTGAAALSSTLGISSLLRKGSASTGGTASDSPLAVFADVNGFEADESTPPPFTALPAPSPSTAAAGKERSMLPPKAVAVPGMPVTLSFSATKPGLPPKGVAVPGTPVTGRIASASPGASPGASPRSSSSSSKPEATQRAKPGQALLAGRSASSSSIGAQPKTPSPAAAGASLTNKR